MRTHDKSRECSGRDRTQKSEGYLLNSAKRTGHVCQVSEELTKIARLRYPCPLFQHSHYNFYKVTSNVSSVFIRWLPWHSCTDSLPFPNFPSEVSVWPGVLGPSPPPFGGLPRGAVGGAPAHFQTGNKVERS